MNFFSRLAGCCAATLLLVACGAAGPVPAEPVAAGESRTVYPPPKDCEARPFVDVSTNNLPESVVLGGTVFDARFANNTRCPNNEITYFRLGVYGQPSALSFSAEVTSADEMNAQVKIFPPTDLTPHLDRQADYQVIDVNIEGLQVPPGAVLRVSALGVNVSGTPKKIRVDVRSLRYRPGVGVEGEPVENDYAGENGEEPLIAGQFVTIDPPRIGGSK